MSRLYHLARRKPETIVAAVFLWGPIVIALGLLTGDADYIFWALMLAALPYFGLLVWMAAAAWQASEGIRRVFVVLGLILFLAIAVSVVWGPPPEY